VTAQPISENRTGVGFCTDPKTANLNLCAPVPLTYTSLVKSPSFERLMSHDADHFRKPVGLVEPCQAEMNHSCFEAVQLGAFSSQSAECFNATFG
jgi:hypothetical protein